MFMAGRDRRIRSGVSANIPPFTSNTRVVVYENYSLRYYHPVRRVRWFQ